MTGALRIGIVTRDRYKSWEMKEIGQAAKAAGVSLTLWDPKEYGFDLQGAHPLDRRGDVSCLDGAFGRVDAGCLAEGVRLLALIEGAGIPTINGSRAFQLGRDKAFTSAALLSAGIPHPRTWVMTPQVAVRAATRLPFPLVLKDLTGGQGRGVRRLDGPGQLRAAAGRSRSPLYLQEYRPAEESCDLRIVVLGGKILGAVKRTPPPGEWRANVALGAKVESAEVREDTGRMALAAAEAVDAEFAAVDLIDGPGGPIVLEINVCPAFAGFARATGVDVPRRLIGWLMRRVRQRQGEVYEGASSRFR